MAASTGPVLAIGVITMARQVIIDEQAPDWRVAVGTGIAAGAFALAEKAVGQVAVYLAWLALGTVLLVRIDPKRPSVAEATLTFMNKIGV